MASAPAIGIDLGTSFSVAAVYRNGIVDIIPNLEGGYLSYLTPSFIFYSPRSLTVSVGTTADDMGTREIKNFLFDVKRIIGRKYDDVYIQEIKKSPEYRFKIVRGDNDMTEIEILYDNVTVQKTPEAASSEILKYLRDSANYYLGVEVTEAVISIPAHFSNAQRKTTRAAAELAGLKVLKLISEPVAAAIHYAEDRLQTAGTLLVFDFGGGTLDVSIIEVDEKSFKVKSVEGDTFLGGRNFDQILLQHFKTDMIRKFGSGIFNDRLARRVKDACTRLKIKLSTQQDYSLSIDCIGGDEGREYILEMTRSKFENLTESLYERAIQLVKKCIQEAGMSRADIDVVVLVGGTTRIPKVRQILSSYFNETKIKTDLNPDEAVARGAAIQAALLKKKLRNLEKCKIIEVTPLSLGIEVRGELMLVFIKKNTPIPAKTQPIRTVTVHNNQLSVAFKVFEGERKMCNFNNFLGSIELTDLPSDKAGTVTFESIFFLSEDGILEVEAYEISSGNKKKLAVTVGEYRLCEHKIKTAVEDAERYKEEDERFEIFIDYQSLVIERCNHILFDIDNIPSKTDREFVKKKCEDLKSNCAMIQYTRIDDLRKEYTAFSKGVKGIICDYIDVKLDEITSVKLNDTDMPNRLVSLMSDINLSDSLLPYSSTRHRGIRYRMPIKENSKTPRNHKRI